jgi:hypothetical protein
MRNINNNNHIIIWSPRFLLFYFLSVLLLKKIKFDVTPRFPLSWMRSLLIYMTSDSALRTLHSALRTPQIPPDPLTWKKDLQEQRINYHQAVKVLESVERQLLRNPDRVKTYTRMPLSSMLVKGLLKR